MHRRSTPRAPAETPGKVLIVSRDRALVHDLRGILETEHDYSTEIAASYSEAAGCLDKAFPAAIFLDLRQAADSEDPSGFLHRLLKNGGGRIPVVAISQAGYGCQWAGMADRVIHAHLRLPLDRAEVARLVDVQLGRALYESSGGLPAPKVVQGLSITVRTYSPEMAQLLDYVVTIAAHNVTVLLTGETGTGKTTLAQLMHELSPRREARLLTVACGALSAELIESELFGHVRGAFTGADSAKIGKLEAAQRGTLLLDEIDVFNPAQQVKLLRVIETGEFEPVGSNETRRCRARLIVASNVDIGQLVATNDFRADLYYRLNVMEFHIPPLRERPGDIASLALGFVAEMCQTHEVTIRRMHPGFLSCLKSYDWPGNIRELKNYVRRAVLFCQSQELTPNDVVPHIKVAMQRREMRESEIAPADDPAGDSLSFRVAATEKAMLEEVLRAHRYNRTAAAKALGLSRAGLYKKLRKYKLLDESSRPSVERERRGFRSGW